jgi:uncharacterized protein (DUF1684 family)
VSVSDAVDAVTALELAEWRRAVGELYARVRALDATPEAWALWQAEKERLYRHHPQSPVPHERRASHAFTCFDHDPAMHVTAELVPTAPRHIDGDGAVPGMTLVGSLAFSLAGSEQRLGAYWLDGYAGGLFVPFVDVTAGAETYGGGRYVIDAAKGADLGTVYGRVVLDFNFAYAPSCAHDPQWRCPLARPENRLSIPVRAGERIA